MLGIDGGSLVWQDESGLVLPFEGIGSMNGGPLLAIGNTSNNTGSVGIQGGGNTAGGYFEDFDDSGYAYVGWQDYGINANGNVGGGYFTDTNDSAKAWVAPVRLQMPSSPPKSQRYKSRTPAASLVARLATSTSPVRS